MIEKSDSTKKFLNNIKRKIQKIENTKNIVINNKDLKKDLIYFNYSYFPIKDLGNFFDFIKKDFDYVVIEESRAFYLDDRTIQNEIKSYVKKIFYWIMFFLKKIKFF